MPIYMQPHSKHNTQLFTLPVNGHKVHALMKAKLLHYQNKATDLKQNKNNIRRRKSHGHDTNEKYIRCL